MSFGHKLYWLRIIKNIERTVDKPGVLFAKISYLPYSSIRWAPRILPKISMVIGSRKMLLMKPLFSVKQEIIGETSYLNDVISLKIQKHYLLNLAQEVSQGAAQKIILDHLKIDLN